jgi:putative membrane protein
MTEDIKKVVSERRNVDTFKLAVHRTELANRRTLMAYIRTAIGLTAASIALLKLLEDGWLTYLGWSLLPIAVICVLIGVDDYHRVRKSINEEKRDGGL